MKKFFRNIYLKILLKKRLKKVQKDRYKMLADDLINYLVNAYDEKTAIRILLTSIGLDENELVNEFCFKREDIAQVKEDILEEVRLNGLVNC